MNNTFGSLSLGLLTLSLLTVMALATASAAAGGSGEQAFVTQAAIGGIAEVEMGKLAGDKASSSEIKKFAAQMVSDHTKANEELEKIATGKSLTVPSALDAKHKAKLEMLSKKTGAEFDKAYVQAQVSGHEKMQQLLDHEAKNSKDADLKMFAEKTLPTVKEHYQMATELQTKVGKQP
jgi:putative membrane protein